MENIFLRPTEFYKRDISPLHQYVGQNSFYLSKMSGKNIEECKEFIIKGIKNKVINAADPIVHYYQRDTNGDKKKTSCFLSNYINTVVSENEILAPTFTTYLQSSVKPSLLVNFILNSTRIRSKVKIEAAIAKANKQIDLFIAKDNEQANHKLYSNGASGGFASEGTILHNPTAHSTLTSITRTVSSLGNASNEKIISGNRHYRNPDVTLYDIINITSSLDKESFRNIITKYNLKYPSIEETESCILYSTDLYWRDRNAFNKIHSFILNLEDVERAAIVYISDLYHIRLHNESFVRTFLTELSSKITDVVVPDPLATLKSIDSSIINYVHQICLLETRGIGKDYSKIMPEQVNTIAATSLNVINVIMKYRDFIENIFLTKNTPSGTAFIRNMIRRTVVVSDTDSTMFAMDEWVIWYFGKLVFHDEAFALSGSIMYLSTQCMAHILAMFSANISVERSKLYDIQLKPEFVFPVFAQTSVSKHYYTCIMVKEGSVFKELDREQKGVHLKNSASPKSLIEASSKKMDNILATVMRGEKISIIDELKDLASIERNIQKSLLNGEVEYYKKSKVKQPEAYARGEAMSPYLHHLFWVDIFADKYGSISPPPYTVIKIPTTVLNITGVKEWLANIEDKELATRLSSWLIKYDKTDLPTIYISISYITSFGIPEEIKSVINIKKIVLDLTLPNRIILQSLGYFPKHEMLISEVGY